MVEGAEQWEWSSYAVTDRLVIPPPWSDRSGVLGSFARQEKVAVRRYLEFVANGVQ